jgi:hypothetical protein
MKVIRQIIHYLRGQGILSSDQFAEFVRRGLLPDPEELNDDDYDCPCCSPFPRARSEDRGTIETDDPTHDVSDRLSRTARPSWWSGRPKGRSLTAAGLCAGLARCFPSWDGPLAGLRLLGDRLTPCASWGEAALVIRNSAPDQVTRTLGQALVARDLPWDAFWNAVGLDAYVTVVGDPGLHGPAISAYRVALRYDADALAQARKYSWLLRYAEIRHVFNLLQAQRVLLRAWGALLADRPDPLGTVIAQSRHPLGYWTSVLIHSARRCQVDAARRLHGDERPPARARPDHETWLRAWACATIADPAAVTALMATMATHDRILVASFSTSMLDAWNGLDVAVRRVLIHRHLLCDSFLSISRCVVCGSQHQERRLRDLEVQGLQRLQSAAARFLDERLACGELPGRGDTTQELGQAWFQDFIRENATAGTTPSMTWSGLSSHRCRADQVSLGEPVALRRLHQLWEQAHDLPGPETWWLICSRALICPRTWNG